LTNPLSALTRLARERIIVFDGAMGTMLKAAAQSPDDYHGHSGCIEYLALSRPDIVRRVHADYFAAGADVVETNTLGAAAHTLAEHGLERKCLEMNRAAARLARDAAGDFSSRARPRFVAGSIGPGSKLPSLGQIEPGELQQSYLPQITGLLKGGVDCLIVETSQDLLQVKSAVAATLAAFRRHGKAVPVIASVTLDRNGLMLAGSDIAAVLATLEPLPLFAVGVNCGFGPDELAAAAWYLADHSSLPVALMPNAGLPRLRQGRPHWDLSPADFANQMQSLARRPGLNIVGGCCGTTPEHIRLLAQAVANLPARKPVPCVPRVSSLFRAQEIAVRPKPLIIGERTNASGSRLFRELVTKQDLDGIRNTAQDQEREQAHLIDLSVAVAGRNETKDMAAIAQALNSSSRLPVMIDSTDPAAVEAALQRLAGRCIVNSVNLEDGGKRAARVIELCRTYGAALVCMAIDEHGMAMTAGRKLAVARRLVNLAIRAGLPASSLFLDFLTFTLASGEPSLCNAGRETLDAIRRAKQSFPQCHTLLGVSNVSHGLAPDARRVLNAVFLARAIEAGLDAAILHAGRIVPLHSLDPSAVRLCDNLIFNRGTGPRTPLERLLEHSRIGTVPVSRAADGKPVVRDLIINGETKGLKAALAELLKLRPAQKIVSDDLLPAMSEVGTLFEQGRMQLPFVLRSAEVMRRALDLLKPRLSAKMGTAPGDIAASAVSPFGTVPNSRSERGTLLLATVRGDIHDIGKNLVAMLVSSNGFRVIDLGVRQSPEAIIAAVKRHSPNAIGLSGLLVESARAMKEYVELFARAGIRVPVLCGGAALSKTYVTRELQPAYAGRVIYARDAMSGLRTMQDICSPARTNATASSPQPRALHIPLSRFISRLDRLTLYERRWLMKKDSPKADGMLASLLRTSTRRKLWQPQAIYARFEARVAGRALLVRPPGEHGPETPLQFSPALIQTLRQRNADETFPVALQIVTIGPRVKAECDRLAAEGDIHTQFLLHGLAAELTEALAEHVHLSIEREMTREPGRLGQRASAQSAATHRGQTLRRLSPGYPVWPDLSEQRKLFHLLHPERIGLTLTAAFQMVPEYSTSAILIPRG
jgi:5-methyltetrahydrofolate--homocysteine methyltransferase